ATWRVPLFTHPAREDWYPQTRRLTFAVARCCGTPVADWCLDKSHRIAFRNFERAIVVARHTAHHSRSSLFRSLYQCSVTPELVLNYRTPSRTRSILPLRSE